mmetsp:Transcript_16265/g.36585  ORF Transcript_16265/g.36585 Transcript_16265/m.36585 type:complete len:102 (+) Transcript_16265:688-993(+)
MFISCDLNEVFLFCCMYFCNAYNMFGDSALTTYRKETDEGVELLLHSFEVSSLMNLMATDTTAEEALALIPSLSRFPEAAIDEILELIRGTMIRIGPRIVS